MSESVLVANLKAEMSRLGLNEYALAIAAGLKAGAVRDIIHGRSKSPRGDTLDSLAGALGRTVGQLLGSEPMTGSPKPPLTRLPPEMVKDQTQLQLLRWWSELERRDQKVILRVVEALVDNSTIPP